MARINPPSIVSTVERGTSFPSTAGAPRQAAAAPLAPQDKQEPTKGGAPVTETKGVGLDALTSDETIGRFVGASLGGALLGSSYASVPMVGAALGAAVGIGVVLLRTWHGH